MGAWVRVAEFTKAKHLKGGLVARSVAGLPFLLEEGLFCAFVPPVIDVPRQGTVLIPVVDEFLEGVDEQTRCIYVNVPQGLLDL